MLSDSLTHLTIILINFSITAEHVPGCMKIEKELPLYEIKKRNQMTDYRSILILTALWDILEKVDHKRI